MAISYALVAGCNSVVWMLVLKLMIPPERNTNVDLAFSGLPMPYEASQKLMSSKLLFRV